MSDPGARRGGRQSIPRPAEWAPGPPAPWGDRWQPRLDDLLDAVSVDDSPFDPAFPDARPAAVLIVLAELASGPEVLLTRRSQEMRNHPGEISFPGGRLDPGESAVDAALREAHEEVGLDPALVTVQGELTHLNTPVSHSYVIPKVATVAGRPAVGPRTAEVDRVLWVPVADLTAPGTYRSERWSTRPVEWVLHFFELPDETVWGATGRMLFELLSSARR